MYPIKRWLIRRVVMLVSPTLPVSTSHVVLDNADWGKTLMEHFPSFKHFSQYASLFVTVMQYKGYQCAKKWRKSDGRTNAGLTASTEMV